ncbi:hypothetical protein MtrunA17_Chr4g0036101 [Medicago truncatula]|uniref:Uncharacterized protein n=1 Tax=Medicago truncatula TaxID=3880 RepID=A0A396I6Z2_MEDTR|nr:hypothetical protein MtrunA17_Chr4g0036101 [Medicago truncatula]
MKQKFSKTSSSIHLFWWISVGLNPTTINLFQTPIQTIINKVTNPFNLKLSRLNRVFPRETSITKIRRIITQHTMQAINWKKSK